MSGKKPQVSLVGTIWEFPISYNSFNKKTDLWCRTTMNGNYLFVSKETECCLQGLMIPNKSLFDGHLKYAVNGISVNAYLRGYSLSLYKSKTIRLVEFKDFKIDCLPNMYMIFRPRKSVLVTKFMNALKSHIKANAPKKSKKITKKKIDKSKKV